MSKWLKNLRPWHRVVLAIFVLAMLVFLTAWISAFQDLLSDREASAVTVPATMQVTHILGPQDFDALGRAVGRDFGVASASVIALSVGGALHVLDNAGSAMPNIRNVEVSGPQPDSFALDSEGPMLTIAGGYFGLLGANGEIENGIPLPFGDMRLAPSVHAGAVYLFGGAQRNFRLYRFIDDGSLQILLETDVPLVGAADDERNIYAATASTILRIKAGAPDVLFQAPEDFSGPIRSIAVAGEGTVYFSTDTKVYVLAGSDALSIVNDAGGTLRVLGNALYVLDPSRRILFRLDSVATNSSSESNP